MKSILASLLGFLAVANAAPSDDLVTTALPGFASHLDKASFITLLMIRPRWARAGLLCLISSKLYKKIQATCAFSETSVPFDSSTPAPDPSLECSALLDLMEEQVGPFNIFNVYDNCPNEDSAASFKAWREKTGKGLRWVRQYLLANIHRPIHEVKQELSDLGGGYDWTCGQFDAIPDWFSRSDVRSALHLPETSMTSQFNYDLSGPASVTLYPSLLASGLRVLIYNGDADACVPYIGNEIWTTGMEAMGVVEEVDAWHTWFAGADDATATGAATSYKVVGGKRETGEMFQFITVRLAGHEVPGFAPRAGFAVFDRFVKGEVF